MFKTSRKYILLTVLATLGCSTFAVDRYVSLSGGHVPPFANWGDAATNIQDAIDVASPGETVWVTNGVYTGGGKVMDGDLTNRVALDKAVTVQSVNGPVETIIQGQWDAGGRTGLGAVRVAWLTNGAMLRGFTLCGGATRTNASPTLQSGGGVWGASTNAVVAHCVIQDNAAYVGGGSYGCTLSNCTLTRNLAQLQGGGAAYGVLNQCILMGNRAEHYGGGSAFGTLNNCALKGNSGRINGGGSYFGTLNNCTVTDNKASTGAGGSFFDTLNNCIVWGNQATSVLLFSNYYTTSTLRYTCAGPLAPGPGNIAVDPQLLADGTHIAATSPCRGAGSTNYVMGTDIDGQAWADLPDMGCDEWQPAPVATTPLQWQPTSRVGPNLVWTAIAGGQEPFTYWWTKDGAPVEDGPHYDGMHNSSLLVRGFEPGDAGYYQIVVSNAFGVTTSQVARLVIHCVDAAATSPLYPYTNWATATPTIQMAIDAASSGALILVTNGVYATGSKLGGDLGDVASASRVALDKALTVWSVNGEAETIIQGQRDPVSTNGPAAVRCAWLTHGARLSGFTLRGGAALSGYGGGGVRCASEDSVVANCVIKDNIAEFGGGSYGGTLNNCILTGNSAVYSGGGCMIGTLNNCVLTDNSALYGGGSDSGTFNNCTLTGNRAQIGGGAYSCRLKNCIVWGNAAANSGSNYLSYAEIRYTCTSPLTFGPGNIDTDPQLMDAMHIAITSPCRGVGTNAYASGVDIDGEPWTNPPSMGCDEVWETGITGSLAAAASAPWVSVASHGSLPLSAEIEGRASRVGWDYGDGSILTNASLLDTSHVWTNAGDYMVAFTVFNADNPEGVSTNLLVHVVPLEAPAISTSGLSGTNFSLSFPGQPGVTYVVEQATNLAPPVTWETVSTVSSTGSVMHVIDTNATNEMSFYRVNVP